MREALLKRRYGVPAALLILLVLAGVATAFLVHNFNCSTITQEPLTFEKTDPLDIKCQGESDNIVVTVSNASSKMSYGIFVDAQVIKGHVDSITYGDHGGRLVGTEKDLDIYVNEDDDKLDAWYNIEPGNSDRIVVTVDSADDAAPGELIVRLSFQRQAEY